MLPATPGWTRRYRGDVVELHSARGVIRFREELAPIPRLPRGGGAPAIERFFTDEGEHGVLVTAPGKLAALVLGDRHYERLDARGDDPELAAALRAIARGVTLGLGVRRRRVFYAPPRGWLPLRRGLVTDWIGPAPPRGTTIIRVYPAVPSKQSADEILGLLLASDEAAGLATERIRQQEMPGGLLRATRVKDGARVVWRDWAVFRQGAYALSARLESLDERGMPAARETFTALVASIEPIPEPVVRPAPATTPLPWVD